MKALASAEKEKKEKTQLQQEINAEAISDALTLAPLEETQHSPAIVYNTEPSMDIVQPDALKYAKPILVAEKKNPLQKPTKNHQDQQAAANVFFAAQLPTSHFNKVILALGAVAMGLMIWLGSALLPYEQTSQQLLNNDHSANQLVTQTNTTLVHATNVEIPVNDTSAPITKINPTFSEEKSSTFEKLTPFQDSNRSEKVAYNGAESLQPKKDGLFVDNTKKKNYDALLAEELMSEQNPAPHKTQNQVEPKHALNLISQQSNPSVDPTLLSAYQAFNKGELPQAQQQYRQVLQKDVRNIDALLGMAAIAEKQGRYADAAGWYQKVLEIEPHHTLATTAILNMQTQTDATSQISRIKNLIAQQPESASLHASLGNAYAQQNDWLSAQAAYFEATRFAPSNADYAFNLAVSLEHLGKPAIALLQYQRALMLVQHSGAQSPDQLILKTRITTLQQ